MSKSESGAQLLARLGARQSLDGLDPNLFDMPINGQVFQFSGMEGTGKSELLLHLLVKCILPKTWNTLQLGGFGVRVILIDCDYKFSVLRLALVLEKRILKAVEQSGNATAGEGSSFSIEDVEPFIKACLKNLYLIHCSSSQQLLCTVHSVETIFSTEPEVSCFMIDSISAFYWPDRCSAGDSALGQEKVMNCIVKSLEKIVKGYNLVLFVTKAEIFRDRSRDPGKGDNSSNSEDSLVAGYSEYLGKAWGNFVDQRYVLTKNTVGNKVTFSAVHKSWKCPRQFTISDYGVLFL
ncbi:DNA repair protein XRCC2-like [Gigantopelta aegis]|uniref:DNA repair protein XRCC2-like n=1 Tax=Gigantopelta aegis TaxID=1735272 RepID=UPI001B8897E3|nr:DNA repair protein XRCC2-like [Gigantopelta aegis]